jgi:peptidoglycan hydrolase-like protein with peptidoglycan-binding domain
MLCIRFLAGARRWPVVAAALLLAILAVPSSASAGTHGAAGTRHASDAIVRVGDGYASPGGSRSVRRVQRRLHSLGYDAGPTDGLFGPLTEGAVARFQHDHGLTTDGVIGPLTAVRLRTTTPPIRLGAGYRMPHGSQRVRTIQRHLRSLGYAPGPVDGRFGPRTARAVVHYQADRRLVADGEVGPKTSKRLLPHTKPSQPSRTAARPPAIPDLPTGERPLTSRPALHTTQPHGPPVAAVLIALVILGLAVVSITYLRTRARLAEAARGQRTMSTVNGGTGRQP